MQHKEHCTESQKTWVTGLWLVKSSESYIIHFLYPFPPGTDPGIQMQSLSSVKSRPWDKDLGTGSWFGRWSQEAGEGLGSERDKGGRKANKGVLISGSPCGKRLQSSWSLSEAGEDAPRIFPPRGKEPGVFFHQLPVCHLLRVVPIFWGYYSYHCPPLPSFF